jgi:hypothetical protein
LRGDVTTPKEISKAYAKAAKAVAAGESRAVKRAGNSVRTAQVREIGKVLNVRSGAISKAIVTKREPGARGLEVVHRVRGEGLPLRDFIGTRQTRKGVSVKVLKIGPRVILGAAFQRHTLGGHVFGRAGKSTPKRYGRPHVGRLPIVKLFGPNVLSQYINDAIRGLGEKTWHERIAIELERDTTFALKRAGVL